MLDKIEWNCFQTAVEDIRNIEKRKEKRVQHFVRWNNASLSGKSFLLFWRIYEYVE